MKKKNLLYIACILTTASLSSCDDFLDKEPQDKLTNNTYWQTENSLRTYAPRFLLHLFQRIWHRLYSLWRLFLGRRLHRRLHQFK